MCILKIVYTHIYLHMNRKEKGVTKYFKLTVDGELGSKRLARWQWSRWRGCTKSPSVFVGRWQRRAQNLFVTWVEAIVIINVDYPEFQNRRFSKCRRLGVPKVRRARDSGYFRFWAVGVPPSRFIYKIREAGLIVNMIWLVEFSFRLWRIFGFPPISWRVSPKIVMPYEQFSFSGYSLAGMLSFYPLTIPSRDLTLSIVARRGS